MTKPKSYWDEIALLLDGNSESYECRICWRRFVFLGAHIRVHDLTEMEYKDKFGILHSVPLCVPKLRSFFSRHNKRLRDEAKIGRPEHIEAFVSSERNAANIQPPQSIASRTTKNRGRKFGEEVRQHMSTAAIKRNISPEYRKKISKSIKAHYEPTYLSFKCDYCGATHWVRASDAKKKKGHRVFCGRLCFNAFLRENGKEWAGHIKRVK